MRFDLYNCEDRQVDGTLNKIEPCLAAALFSKAMYMVSVEVEPTDSVEDCEFEEQTLMNLYTPKKVAFGPISFNCAYGWKYQLLVDGKDFKGGSANTDILKEAREYAVANNKTIKVYIWAIDGDGSPLERNVTDMDL